MKMKYITFCSFIFCSSVFAKELPPSQPVFFNQAIVILPELLLDPMANTEQTVTKMAITASLEEQINQAIVTKKWHKLKQLLDQYQTTENYDQILYLYGAGALYRFQGKQKQAIEMYQQIIKNNPNLYYPRFDLAMMLFEDKQYEKAKKEFETTKPFLSSQMQILIDQLLMTMKKSQEWQTKVNLDFKKTDNVNQSSNLEKISIGDAVFIRDQESLPQKAQGFGYALNISRDYNVLNNHYLSFNSSLDGVNYWDNHDYSEQTIRFDFGYKFRDIKQSIGINPLFAQNILADSRYSKNYGVGLNYNRILSDRWQISSNTSYIEKRYRDGQLAKYYDGYSKSQSVMLIHQFKPRLIVYGGLDFIQDRVLDNAESSNRKGVRSGFMYYGEVLGLSTNFGYSKRDFLADNFLYRQKRLDNEFNFSITAWNKKWQWKNFTPKINYEYQKINSNLELYGRNNGTIFMTIDKAF